MTRYVNYSATGNAAPTDLSEVLTAIASAGMPGEVKLAYSANGTVPAGTTRLDLPTDQVVGTLNTVQLASLGNFMATVGDESATNVTGNVNANTLGALVLDNNTHAFVQSSPYTNLGKNFVLWDKASGAWVRTALPAAPGGSSTTTDLFQHTKCTHLLENNQIIFINWGKYGASLNSSISPSTFFHVYNGSSWVMRTSSNVNLWYGHSFSVGNNVYLLGGGQTSNGSGQQATRFLKYDPVANAWTTLAVPPFNCNAYRGMYTDPNSGADAYIGGGRNGAFTATHSAVQLGSKIYVALNGYYNTDGGTSITNKSADAFVTMYIYDTVANTWSAGVQVNKPTTTFVNGTNSTLVGTLIAIGTDLYLAGAMLSQDGGLGVSRTQLKKLNTTDLSVTATYDVVCQPFTGVSTLQKSQANSFSYAQGSAPKLLLGTMWMVGGPALCAALGTYKANSDTLMYVYKN